MLGTEVLTSLGNVIQPCMPRSHDVGRPRPQRCCVRNLRMNRKEKRLSSSCDVQHCMSWTVFVLHVASGLDLAETCEGQLQQVWILTCCLFTLADLWAFDWCLHLMNSFLLAGALDPWDVQFHSN